MGGRAGHPAFFGGGSLWFLFVCLIALNFNGSSGNDIMMDFILYASHFSDLVIMDHSDSTQSNYLHLEKRLLDYEP